VATRYTYLWEFLVELERIGEFERHYGPRGTWVALFRQSPGYIETLMLRDPANPLHFITIDRWETLEAYQSFRSRFSREYAELDERCQHLTTKETLLGEYNEAIA
jgi:heme-degrading monooxygenase HmoA